MFLSWGPSEKEPVCQLLRLPRLWYHANNEVHSNYHFWTKNPLLGSELSLMVKLNIFQGYYGARAAAFPRAWRQGSSRRRGWQENRQEDVLPGLWILPLDHSWYRAARSASGLRRLARARYDHSPFFSVCWLLKRDTCMTLFGGNYFLYVTLKKRVPAVVISWVFVVMVRQFCQMICQNSDLDERFGRVILRFDRIVMSSSTVDPFFEITIFSNILTK